MRTSSAARQFVTLLIVVLPAFAAAQEPVRSFDQLNTRLKVGDTVWVTDAQGREVKGQIRDFSETSLTLDSGGPARLQADAVRLITQREGKPIVRGMLIGLGVGAASFAVVAAMDCDDCGEAVSGGLMFGALIGAGAGAAIGAMRSGKEVVVYRAPGPSGSARLSLAPVITPRTKGVALFVSF